jgi:ParB family chromosome partitioning protein
MSADADTRALENELAEKLGTRVTVKADKKGRGRLVIDFMSLEHLEGILERSRLK